MTVRANFVFALEYCGSDVRADTQVCPYPHHHTGCYPVLIYITPSGYGWWNALLPHSIQKTQRNVNLPQNEGKTMLRRENLQKPFDKILNLRKMLEVRAEKADGAVVLFKAISRLNTDIDVTYYEHGGILPYVLRKLMRASA